MTIAIGDSLPTTEAPLVLHEEVSETTVAQLFADKKVALFGVPIAFSPTCSEQHIPGFLALEQELKAAGVEAIVCLCTCNEYVAKGWQKAQNAGSIYFLADADASFTKGIGFAIDLPRIGPVSNRFAAIVENGNIAWIAAEDKLGEHSVSSAKSLLAAAKAA